ncbi:MAG: VCBS repeat-containing protein [Thermoflexales bacterium]|nr:VCBS repeat-containing protein [Thermoflexales bacterium]
MKPCSVFHAFAHVFVACRSIPRRLVLALLPGLLAVAGLALLWLPVLPAAAPAPTAASDLLPLAWSSFEIDDTNSIAWGDLDGDGDLDLAVGNFNEPNRLYRNDSQGGVTTMTLVWSSDEKDCTNSVAWGDVDNDGDLDLAVGNLLEPNRLYRNASQGEMITMTLAWSSAHVTHTTSVAWGDVDGDGFLDLAVGNNCSDPGCHSIQLYLNEGGTLTTSVVYSNVESHPSYSLAWGDVDNDGDLDLAAGNYLAPDTLYRNDGGTLTAQAVYSTTEQNPTCSIAWGDYDDDGYLDLAVGSCGTDEPSKVYRNLGWMLSASAVYSTADVDDTYSVAWGDVDADGDLDLATGNRGQPNKVYFNEGGVLSASPAYASIDADETASLAWGDVDADGDFDLAVGNGGGNRVYRNDGGTLSSQADYTTTELNGSTLGAAWGDVDNDGDLDLVIGGYLHYNASVLSASPSYFFGGDGTGVTWADVDDNAYLDLLVGNCLYTNSAGLLSFTPAWMAVETDTVRSADWGDVDNDGDLDLALANSLAWLPAATGGHTYLYRNEGGELSASPVYSTAGLDDAHSVAWGDVDNDGDLDLLVGSLRSWNGSSYVGGQNKLYRNEGGVLSASAVYSTAERDDTYSVAWGDVDNDGDLDLAVGNGGQPNRLYRNEGGSLTPHSVWSSVESDTTYSVAWGDVDNDGDLDLAVGNIAQPNRVYRNDGGVLSARAAWSAYRLPNEQSYSVAWGDVDNDGDLDLAAGNKYAENASHVYVNRREGRFNAGAVPLVHAVRPGPNAGFHSAPTIWPGASIPISYTLFNPSGERVRTVRAYYSVSGGGNWQPAVAASGTQTTHLEAGYHYLDSHEAGGPSYNWIDIRTTGTTIPLTDDQVSHVYPIGFQFPFFNYSATFFQVSSNGWLSLSPASSAIYSNLALPDPSAPANLIAPFWDDLDPSGHGDVYYQTVNSNTLVVSYIGVPRYNETLSSLTFQAILRRDGSIAFQYRAMTGTLDSATVGFQNRYRNVGLQVAYNEPYVTSTLAGRSTLGVSHVYTWNPIASGMLGQSDDVVFRLEAVPAITPTCNSIPGPYLHGAYGSQTYPFRARGTQIRVMSDTVPAAGALVYRLPKGEREGGALIADDAGIPFHTDAQGYLQGRGELAVGDQLLALVPITWTDTYTLYYTSGTPTELGMDTHTVSAAGVQTLAVSAEHPLLVFDLSLSLEWDAHSDTSYLEELAYNLQRASEHLYDFTNGQVALGQVDVYQNADEWAYGHVAVRANNRLRPFAAQGGIVLTDTADPQHPDIVYAPGQVTMGAIWNRYGNPGQSLGEDWAIILAHELSHYLLYHDDTYLGLDESGYLKAVTTCVGSAMGDLYDKPNNTEFIAKETDWQARCADTLPEKTLGRNEWETMALWYPALITTTPNTGPRSMPFDLTTVVLHDPYTPTQPLLDPTFYVEYVGGVGASTEARAYLLRGEGAEEYVVNLGSPFGGQNRLVAYGAQPGDRLCVFDRPHAQYGCEWVAFGDDRLALEKDDTWDPLVLLTPVNSTTLAISVTNAAAVTYPVLARLYPEFGYGGAPVTLMQAGLLTYTGVFTTAYPAMVGDIQVWVEETGTETNPRRETMVAYGVGGNPGYARAGGGYARAGGGYARAGGGYARAGGGYARAGGAPVMSPDGQMILFTDNPINFVTGTLFVVQAMAGLPDLPPGRTVIGQGYNLAATPGASLPLTTSVSIQYLSNDVQVAGADESELALYHWDGDEWVELDTNLDTYFNLVSAPLPQPGPGIYALMASVRIPLHGPGWNNFAYPLYAAQPVSQALLSIGGYYTTVYGYEAGDALDHWKVYDVDVPGRFQQAVNDLEALEFGKGYWINVSQGITLYLGSSVRQAAVVLPPGLPATYYGVVAASGDFTHTANMTVVAKIQNAWCGLGKTSLAGEEIVYVVDVLADDPDAPGCGAAGRTVKFWVGGQPTQPSVTWSSGLVTQLDLGYDPTAVSLRHWWAAGSSLPWIAAVLGMILLGVGLGAWRVLPRKGH